jgi:hypothetical protein
MATYTPLLINPIAYAACTIGCSALSVSEGDDPKSARFMPDGTIVFEKESPEYAEACKLLVTETLTHAACLSGCAAGSAAVARWTMFGNVKRSEEGLDVIVHSSSFVVEGFEEP